MVAKKFLSTSEKQTRDFGETLAQNLKGKTIFLLKGNLGSGKTTFVQGLAQGLGIKKRIISPTFIFIRKYQKCFYHVDLYRVKNTHDLESLGLKEILENKNSIIAVEWAEKLKKSFCKLDKLSQIIQISFKYINENQREITIHG